MRFRQSTQRNKRNLICMQVEYHADTDTHTCTHTYMHAQPDGAVCRACPIKVHPLVKKMYGCNALPQAHKNTNTYTDTQLQGCMYTLIAKQHNSQSFSHTHTHTHTSDLHCLIYFPPQQMQWMQYAEESSTTISASVLTLFSPPCSRSSPPFSPLSFVTFVLFSPHFSSCLQSIPLQTLTGDHILFLKVHCWFLLNA